MWDIAGGFCTHSFTGHAGVVMRVLFHPKQLQLFSGGDDGSVRVWDLVDKTCAHVLKVRYSRRYRRGAGPTAPIGSNVRAAQAAGCL